MRIPKLYCLKGFLPRWKVGWDGKGEEPVARQSTVWNFAQYSLHSCEAHGTMHQTSWRSVFVCHSPRAGKGPFLNPSVMVTY